MKAYIKDNFVIAIGENDSLFSDCTPIEINEQQKEFIEGCKYPKYNGVDFFDEPITTLIVPEKANKVAFKKELIKAGISLTSVKQAIEAITDVTQRELLLMLWFESDDFYRNNEDLINFANVFNINSAQLDQLFINANKSS